MDLSSLVQAAFEQYRSFNQQHPVTGSILTASVLFPPADVISQLAADKRVNWRKVGYTLGLVPAYGAYAYFSVWSGEMIGKYISAHPLAKAALGPNLCGLGFNLFFFVNNTVGERSNYQLPELGRHYASLFTAAAAGGLGWPGWSGWYSHLKENLKEKMVNCIPWRQYAYSALGTLTFWNAVQYTNYSYIPEELRTPSTLAVAFGWTVLLSFWSLKGRRTSVESPQYHSR